MAVEWNCYRTVVHMMDGIREGGHWILALITDPSLCEMASQQREERMDPLVVPTEAVAQGFRTLPALHTPFRVRANGCLQ